MTTHFIMEKIKILFILCAISIVTECQSAPIINFTIMDETPISYNVGSIKEIGAPLLNLTNTNETYSYFFLSSSKYQSMFHINRETGDLTTSVVIDRESVCEFLLICILTFDVGVQPEGAFLKSITVNVYVEDINDNAPLFPKESMTLQISEGVKPGSVFRIDSPMDKDTGANNSIQSYEILPNSDVFGLEKELNLGNSVELKIKVKSKLDREDKDFYQLTVVAKDGGSPPKSGEMTIDIHVLDVNDNEPEFSNKTYNVTMNENTPPKSVILTLSASDADIGENGRVTYRISDHQTDTETIKNNFEVDEQSGDLKIKTDLKDEQGKTFIFVVEAVDHGKEKHVSQAEVIINIRDSANNEPVVILVPSSGGNLKFINISESAALGFFVASLEVVDTDSGPNGNISCISLNQYFSVDYFGSTDTVKRFIVTVHHVLDRESVDIHNVTVICSDQGSPKLSSSVNFYVRVTDKNDNEPVFRQDHYVGYIQENNNLSAIILQVSATDEDVGNNGLIQYFLHEDANGIVTIGSNSGILYAAMIFNREDSERHIFRILATDLGDPALTGTATMTLFIEDKNDQVPQFINTVNPFQIFEKQASNTVIGYLEAVDGDTGINAELSYEILPEYSSIPFTVFKDGLIKANEELDREVQSRYDFQAQVTDHGEPRLSSIAHVSIFVQDVNDNAPQIRYPSDKNNTVTIFYPEKINAFVSQIQAYDDDEGNNKVLVYSISAGNDLGIFGIDSDNGHVFVQNIVEIDSDMMVSLTILVQDKGLPPLSSSATLKIDVRYTNATTMVTIESKDDSKYIVISVVVVIATILFSGAIIAVIFFLRSLDRNKQKALEEQSRTDSDFGFRSQSSMKPVSTIDSLLNGPGGYTDGQDMQRKKKEVSFSPESSYDPLPNGHTVISLSGCSTLHTETDTDGQTTSPTLSSSLQSSQHIQDKVNTQLESIKLQKLMLHARAKQWVQTQQQQQQQQLHGHLEDSHSHTSGETIPSDSGRGGSEEDIPSVPNSADDPKVFEFQKPEMQPQSQDFFPKVHNPAPFSRNQYTHLKRPTSSLSSRPYSNYMEDRNYQNSEDFRNNQGPNGYPEIPVNRYYTNRPFRDINKSSSWRNPYFTTHSPMDFTGDSSVNSFFENTGTLQSRDDDECSTTTSGSYTLYPEEIL